ncbi:hypothetical protein GCK72_004061 [Caenorhabditis remanei]|uniref:DUF38 domain-containing protein n=1 Tax=Caenorhabditis remanei TaxID=31234 RepID=A0A6A5HBE1_CAERE|nr:hypothetical protein GCK72_004061 [Caenorhabditis remanei]KAF1764114.1 hypothetical protein GCK72_004061 [Caenorhabditis remanei]
MIDDLFIYHVPGDPIKCLESLESTSPYHINKLRGSVPFSLIQKCARASVRNLEITRMEGRKYLVPRLLTQPSLESTKVWHLHLEWCTDLGVGFARKYMELDANIRSSLNFGSMSRDTIGDFIERMGDLRIVDRTEVLVRFETNNPEKHMIMKRFERGEYSREHRFVMVVVSAEIQKSQYDEYVFNRL